MIRIRIRIRFRKEADLRMIGHRDLARVFERMFRRADLRLSMTEGFHPKARVNFPSALALGVSGLDEVMEFEMAEEIPAAELQQRLQEVSPPGLVITSLASIPREQPKPRVQRITYQLPVAETDRAAVSAAVDQFLAADSLLVQRPKRTEPIDVRAAVDDLQVQDNLLVMSILVGPSATVRPQEVLIALGVTDFEQNGQYLTRSVVEIQS